MNNTMGPQLRRLMERYEKIKAQGGDMSFTLGDDPASMEEIATVANAMLDYVPKKEYMDRWEKEAVAAADVIMDHIHNTFTEAQWEEIFSPIMSTLERQTKND